MQGATAQRVPKRLLDDVWRVRATDDDCAICLEAPAQPLILLCGHMFCLDCFQTYATHTREYDDECTRCPTCRSPHAPPPVGQVEAEQVEHGDALLARAMRMDRSRPNFLPLLEGATRFYVAALDLHPYCSRAHAMIGWCRQLAGEDSLDAFEDSARACHGALPAFAIVTLWNQTILDWLGESESAQRIELVRAGARACSWPQAVQREAAGTELSVAENAYRKACSAFEDLTLPRVHELVENLLAVSTRGGGCNTSGGGSGGGGASMADDLAELLGLPPSKIPEKGAYATVGGYISRILTSKGGGGGGPAEERPIWYSACPKCNKKAIGEYGAGWSCESCGWSGDACTHRYIVAVQLIDASGTSYATAYQEQAIAIFGKTADELKAIKDADQSAFEAECSSVLFKRRTFRLRAKIETYQGVDRTKVGVVNSTPTTPITEGKRMLADIMKYDLPEPPAPEPSATPDEPMPQAAAGEAAEPAAVEA